MSTSKTWQLSMQSARAYQEVIVPYLLGPYAEALVTWARIQPGTRVVDVGCGTGAATRAAARAAGVQGNVAGVDVNAYMVKVAGEIPPPAASAPIVYSVENAMALGLPAASADVVISSQMFQFLPDKLAGLREMRRILKRGGHVAIGVWSSPDDNPYFKTQGAVIRQHFGDDVAASLRAGFTLRDPAELHRLLEEAGFHAVEVVQHVMPLAVPEPRDFVVRHLLATPVEPALRTASAEARAAFVADMIAVLTPYMQTEKGNTVVRLPFSANFARGVC